MPLGGLLPYNIGASALAPEPAAPPAQRPGFFDQHPDLISNAIQAFGAGSALRQGDYGSVANLIQNIIQAQEQRRRGRLQDEAQRLREEREARLAQQSGDREERLVGAQEAAEARHAQTFSQQQTMDLQGLLNQIEDNARGTFGSGAPPQGAALEEYITQQANRVGSVEGGDPNALRAMLMGLATMMGQPEPEVPFIERSPDTPPPATVPRGAVVRNAPQARQAPQAPTETMRVGVNPSTGKPELFARDRQGNVKWLGIAPPPSGSGNNALDRIINEAGGGSAPAPASGRGTAPSPAPSGGFTVKAPNGKTYTFKTKIEADAFKRAAGIQ